MSQTRIYRLIPSAGPADAHWDKAPNQGEVVVRATSSGDARVVAALAEADFPETDAMPAHGVSTRFASAFRDGKLYAVVEDNSGRFADAGPRVVLEGSIAPGVITATDAAQSGGGRDK